MVDWQQEIKRTTGFIRILFSAKMSVLGLIILVVFGFLSIAAPIVTPYNPQHDIVAGVYAPPAWYRYFNEGQLLSQNQVLETQPGLPSDPIQSGWQFSSSDPHLSASFDPNTSNSPGSGSMKLTVDRSNGPLIGNFTATFRKSFEWPYKGPPSKFTGSLVMKTPDATPSEPIYATVFIERLGTDAHKWTITDVTPTNSSADIFNKSWTNYPLTTNAWQTPISLDSLDPSVRGVLNVVDLDPSVLIFSSQDQYSYGVTVTFTSNSASSTPLNVYLDDMNLKLYGTSWGLLGTDAYGYDIWSQLIYGARISLAVGLLAAFIGIALGLLVGLMAGYMGKVVDETLMRFTDMLLVIPGLPLLIVLVAVIGNSLGPGRLFALILIIGFLGWMGFARVVRAQVLSLKERPFVEAARAAGAGAGHIATRHIIPNIVGLIYVNLALAVPSAILSEAALSFLGLGDVTVLSWGRMLNLVQENGAQRIWWWVIPPGLAIALVSLSFVMIGFSLDTIFNPRLRQRR